MVERLCLRASFSRGKQILFLYQPCDTISIKKEGDMKKDIYLITVIGFEERQKNLKKGHKAILLSTGFLSNAKIRSLTPVTKLLYLSCLLVAGESTSPQFEVNHESLVYQSGVKSGSLQSQLDLLQELQLVRYEKVTPNRIEKKIKEDKGIEKNFPRPQKKSNDDRDQNRKIWESYANAFRLRYGIEPLRNATVNAQVSSLRKKLGTDDAITTVEFYLKHNDSFYLKNTHSFGLCLRDAETLRTQMMRGKAITMTDAREGEKQIRLMSNLKEAEKGGF